MTTDHEARAREIVEQWSDFKGGSFSGSDLWSLIRDFSAALREAEEAEREACCEAIRLRSLDLDAGFVSPEAGREFIASIRSRGEKDNG